MSNVVRIQGGSISSSASDEDSYTLLKHGGGGGTSGGMDNASRDYVDQKLETAMTRVEGKFDLLNQRLANIEARSPTWWSILGAVMIGVGSILAALAFAGDRFDGGVGLASQQLEQLQRDQAQSEQLQQLLTRFDQLTERLESSK